ncbi:hypothetical protein P6O00_002354, partial [Klebsiella michiganensis]|nr:hypothetical protein [Klebsiella michiganensis]
MSTYKTGNPLGSAAVKDLFDNAENLDFALNSLTALIWTDRLGKTRRSFFGMESAFVTQLTSQESRFNTFIQSSGYQIIGDYTAGPLTLTEYNQLIRYNNELYKLTAATDIPFTTAGNTDETWTDTDAAHFVSVGDAALRQNLGSGDGFKLLGQVRSAAALAALAGEDGDRVLLLGYHDGWAASSSELSGGGEFHYVSSLADVNNGVTVFNGWCRKFTDTVITTYDAGLGDNDGVDARERLTTLFKVVPDGFTVKIRGYHLTSGPVKCEGKTGLTIDGMGGVISAKELR